MISKFVKEQERYTQEDLRKILSCSKDKPFPEDKLVSIIKKLKEFGILKMVKAEQQKDLSDLSAEDIEIADVVPGDNKYLYVFTFVGVVAVDDLILKCYPKYLTNLEPEEELQQVMRVLEKYSNHKEQVIRMFSDNDENQSFNLLPILLFLLQDYYENGVYSNTQEIIESNGSGEILWDKTINETFTLISNNRPYYIDLQTRKHVADDYDYFKRLHECILTKASKELEEAGLLALFEITEVDLTDEELDDFGEQDYILYRIENELNTQFNTRKQLVLKAMHAYVAQNKNLSDNDGFSLFGTNSFNLVWEKVCADIMDNQLDVKLENLNLPGDLKELKPKYQNRKEDKLINLIEKPKWTITGKTVEVADTLKPDLISIADINGKKHFIIFDAKYYTPSLEDGKPPKGLPGIESITKQYLYQLAYQKFISIHDFKVKNCFLMPTEKEEDSSDKGKVSKVSMQILSDLGLEDIKVRFLPAKMAYDLYLSGEKLKIDKLNL